MSNWYKVENNSGVERKQLDNGAFEATLEEQVLLQSLTGLARVRIHMVIAQMRRECADAIEKVRWVAHDQYRQTGNENTDPYEDEQDIWGAFYYSGEWPSLYHEPEDRS